MRVPLGRDLLRPPGEADATDAPGLGRREFLKLAGAGAGLAVAACESPARNLYPRSRSTLGQAPGEADYYATVCRECPAGCGALARVVDGRPVKLEGNPAHPLSGGALCARGQASLLRTYSPDRLRAPAARRDGELGTVSWAEALGRAGRALSRARGAGDRRIVVWSRLETGTLADLLGRLALSLGGEHVMTEPTVSEALLEAYRVGFGRRDLPRPRLEGTDLVVALEAEAFHGFLSPVAVSRQLVGGDRDERATLVSVGPTRAGSALLADQWIPARPGTSGLVALAMLRRLARGSGRAARSVAVAGPELARVLGQASEEELLGRAGVSSSDLTELVGRVVAARRPAVLPPGVLASGEDGLSNAGAGVLAGALLGLYDERLVFAGASAASRVAPPATVRGVVERLAAGEVDVLLVVGANPLFDLPAGLGLEEALERVDLVVSVTDRLHATARASDLVLPAATPLESWGDYAPWEGIDGLFQPTLAPLYEARPVGELVLQIGRRAGLGSELALGARSFEELVRRRWSDLLELEPAEAGEEPFRRAQRLGGRFVEPEAVAARLDPALALAVADRLPASLERAEQPIVIAPYASVGEGFDETALGGWLDELPDPATAAVWGPPVVVGAAAARRLGLEHGRAARLATDQGAIVLPVAVGRGLRDDVIAVPVSGGSPRPDQHLSRLLPAAALVDRLGLAWAGRPVRVEAAGEEAALHVETLHFEQRGRGLVRARGVETGFHEHHVPPRSESDFHGEIEHPRHRWGMAIDLDRCTGCSACVVACQAENNVAVVGPDNVDYGREMQWLQLHLYWERDRRGRSVPLYAPVLCQHCTQAPCESVCPVFAPYHTPDGLNAQVYNRCVGTRFCANNCPYKVRTFNWSRWQWPEPLQLQLNPDVTVRGAGVMEKCTFCVQRIRLVEEVSRLEGRPIAEGELQTACQQTCPTGAIVFGDLADPESPVSRLSTSERAYALLGHLGTRPAIAYLERVVR